MSTGRQPPDGSGSATGNDKSNHFLLCDEVLDQSCAVGNELLDLFEPCDINLLQRHILGIFDTDFAQSTGDFMLLCRNRFEIWHNLAGLSFRLRPHVVNVELFAQPIDPSNHRLLCMRLYRWQMLREKLDETPGFRPLAPGKGGAYRFIFRFQLQTNERFIDLIAPL